MGLDAAEAVIPKAATVIRQVEQLWREQEAELMPRGWYHQRLQQRIARLAARFGLGSVMEYSVQRDGGRQGLIDVVWVSDGRSVVAFEIDSARRRKSIEKLLTLEVPIRFWVYYGCLDPVSFLRTADPRGRVLLIRLENIRCNALRKVRCT